MRRLLKWLLLLIALLLVLVLLVGAWLLGTEHGLKFAASQAQSRVAGLEVDGASGDALRGVNSKAFSFENDALLLKANGLNSAWNIRCLLDKRFCLEKLTLEKLHIATKSGSEPSAPPREGPIALPDIKLPIGIEINQLEIRHLVFVPAPSEDGTPAVPIEAHNITLNTISDGELIRLSTLSADYQQHSVTIEGDITPSGEWPLDIKARLDAHNLIDHHSVGLDLSLNNSLSQLQVKAETDGAVALALNGTMQPLQPDLPAQLSIRAESLGWPLDTQAMARSEQLQIDIDGTLEDYRVTLSTVLGGESVPGGSLTLDANVNTKRALINSLEHETLGGALAVTGSADWSGPVRWDFRLEAEHLDPSQAYPTPPGDIGGQAIASGEAADGRWSLMINDGRFSGELAGRPFALTLDATRNDEGTFELARFNLDSGDNHISASGTLAEAWHIDGQASILQPEDFLKGLQGDLNASFKLRGALKEPDIQLSARSDRFSFNDAQINGLRLDGDIKQAALGDSALQLTIDGAERDGQAIANTRLELAGTREQHALSFFSDGPQQTALSVSATGSLDAEFNWDGLLRRSTIELPAHALQLDKPVALAWSQNNTQFSVAAHCWSSEEAKLCLEDEIAAPGDIDARVRIATYPLNRLDPFLPAGTSLGGELNATAHVKQGESVPGGIDVSLVSTVNEGQARIEDRTPTPLNFQYRTLKLDARARADQIEATLSLDSERLGQADITAQLTPQGETQALSGTVSLQTLDIGIARAILPEFRRINGTLSVEGQLGGVINDPSFTGNVRLANPRLVADILPLDIEGGNLEARVNGKRASYNGELNSGEGTIRIAGDADWRRALWQFNSRISADSLNVQQPPLMESNIDADINVSASPGKTRVRGKAVVAMARINVEELPAGATALSDDVVVIEDIVAAQAEQKAAATNTDLDIRVDVELGDNVRLDAYGLNAQLDGSMEVRLSPPTPPQLGGEIRIVEGTFARYGQDLLIQNGQILFVGPIDRTQLDLEAVREIEGEDRVAGLQVSGAIANPEVTLFTNPADKSQDAILSYIVLGRDINEANAQEQSLLTSAALALAVRGGNQVGTGLADTLGLKNITVDARGRGDDTELVVSSQINDRLLLRYGQGIFNNAEPTLYLRYDITRKLYLEAAQGVQRAVDLFYKFSF